MDYTYTLDFFEPLSLVSATWLASFLYKSHTIAPNTNPHICAHRAVPHQTDPIAHIPDHTCNHIYINKNINAGRSIVLHKAFKNTTFTFALGNMTRYAHRQAEIAPDAHTAGIKLSGLRTICAIDATIPHTI